MKDFGMRIHIHRLFYGQPRSQASLLPAHPENEVVLRSTCIKRSPLRGWPAGDRLLLVSFTVIKENDFRD